MECKEGSCGMGLRCEEPEDALAPHQRGPQKKKKKKNFSKGRTSAAPVVPQMPSNSEFPRKGPSVKEPAARRILGASSVVSVAPPRRG